MGDYKFGRRGIFRAAPTVVLAGLVAACAWGAPNPAPVELKGVAPAVVGGPTIEPAPGALPAAGGQTIVVEHGQSVSIIAHAYHVPERAIIAANHLTPPYKVAAGQHLVIPGGAQPIKQAAMAPPMAPMAAAPPSAPPPAPIAQTRAQPEIIPLDGPPPAKSAASPPRAAALTPPSGPRAEPSAAEDAHGATLAAMPLPHGARFAWPVRGHVLAGYGVTPSGGHNDGINIAAPAGTPVVAVDGGTVAYAGNELRGYGNLVLVKHPSGWITAYAHCQKLLVKRGDTVSRGQEIAKVGSTGGVTEPQLHFELRRGKHAVDPREFLAPAPTAGGRKDANAG
ncbi:MAG TPA: M23 family metallopeptidase [Stellaceae bacterium]|nr:M23 family metallopeptidase [Stellaceae bacterium]